MSHPIADWSQPGQAQVRSRHRMKRANPADGRYRGSTSKSAAAGTGSSDACLANSTTVAAGMAPYPGRYPGLSLVPATVAASASRLIAIDGIGRSVLAAGQSGDPHLHGIVVAPAPS